MARRNRQKKATPRTKRTGVPNRTMLLSVEGTDHIARPLGGGKDTQMTRARLSTYGSWNITASSSQTIGRNPQTSLEWATYSNIYDQYKVNGMRVRLFFPKFIVSGGGFTVYPEFVVCAFDNDSIAAPASIAATMGLSTMMVEAAEGIVSYSCPTLPIGTNYGASALGYISSAEWTDVASPQALAGIITCWLTRVAAIPGGYSIGFLVEHDVTFKGKRN